MPRHSRLRLDWRARLNGIAPRHPLTAEAESPCNSAKERRPPIRRLLPAQAAAAAQPPAGTLRQGARSRAPVPRWRPGGVPRPALPGPLRRRGPAPAGRPDRRQRDIVLAAVKDAARRRRRWPAAILDRACARCPRATAGRDEETALRSNQETDVGLVSPDPTSRPIGNATRPGRPPLPIRPINLKKRTFDVLPKPDNLISYRQTGARHEGANGTSCRTRSRLQAPPVPPARPPAAARERERNETLEETWDEPGKTVRMGRSATAAYSSKTPARLN